MTGTKFGKLTVLKMLYKKNDDNTNTTFCECQCECGNIVTRSLQSLAHAKRGAISSCGCASSEIANSKVRDIVGDVFGRLTVVEEIKTPAGRNARCICDCGNEIIVVKRDVTTGHTQSCGCLQSERASEANQKDWTNYVSDYGVTILNRHHKNNKGQWLWECKCFCGNHFIILPIKITSGHTTSCGCRIQSSREYLIEEFLKKNNITYKRQFTFPDCKNKYVLRFDFALLKEDEVFYLIEYDGMQHYMPIQCWGGIDGYEKTAARDKIKNEYCFDNNIPLLRLKYDLTDQEIIEKIANILKP